MEEREEKVAKFLSYFEGKEFKNQEMRLGKAEVVVDLNKFINYHVSLIKRSHNKRFAKPYILALNRIKKQLEKNG